jgi:DNA-binding HxlR family transcriptional regulator
MVDAINSSAARRFTIVLAEANGSRMTESWRSSGPFLHSFAERWTLDLLAELAGGGRRYPNLHDALDGISYKVLTDALRRAERDGLISRRLDPERIESATPYELTDLGRSLDVPLGAVDRWVETNRPGVESAHPTRGRSQSAEPPRGLRARELPCPVAASGRSG